MAQIVGVIPGGGSLRGFAERLHFRPASLHGLHGEGLHPGRPDAGGADGIHQQGQPLPAVLPEQLALDLQGRYPAVPPAGKAEQAVQAQQHGVDGAGLAALGDQGLFPAGRSPLCHGPPSPARRQRRGCALL